MRPEDLEEISGIMRPLLQAQGRSPTKLAIQAAFVERVQQNLHLVLCMSPVGDAFRYPVSNAFGQDCVSLRILHLSAAAIAFSDGVVSAATVHTYYRSMVQAALQHLAVMGMPEQHLLFDSVSSLKSKMPGQDASVCHLESLHCCPLHHGKPLLKESSACTSDMPPWLCAGRGCVCSLHWSTAVLLIGSVSGHQKPWPLLQLPSSRCCSTDCMFSTDPSKAQLCCATGNPVRQLCVYSLASELAPCLSSAESVIAPGLHQEGS